jgi:uncharacterized membrane protein YjjP (DUF1212 family)
MARAFWGILTVLTPFIFLAVPGMVVSVVCGSLGIALRNRTLLLVAAFLSAPMFLYILMGEAWWRPVIPFIVGMCVAAAYVVPQRRGLALLLVAPYFVFVAMLIGSIAFREPQTYRNRVEWRTFSP